MNRVLVSLFTATSVALVSPSHSFAEDTPPSPQLAATVNGEKIFVAEIHREVARATRGQEVDPARYRRLSKTALEQSVNRRLVLAFLKRRKSAATADETTQQLDLVKRKLAEQEVTLADYLARTGMTEDELRFTLAWEVGWQRYMARYLQDANLEKYFAKHRRDFDGTKMQVAHILWKVDAHDRDAMKAAVTSARSIREQIVSEKMTFDAAARKYSAAPTKDDGGDIGEISRHAPMSGEFSKAAFALNKGDVSEPLTSPFGVHLIRCLDVTPGKRTWQDARQELVPAVERYLFDWTIEQERPIATVKIEVPDGVAPPKK